MKVWLGDVRGDDSAWGTRTRRRSLVPDLRKELGRRDADLRARLVDARHGGLEVVVAFERRADEAVEGRVVEHLPPREVGERGGVRGIEPPAEVLRCVDGRSLVVRTDLEAPQLAEEALSAGGSARIP